MESNPSRSNLKRPFFEDDGSDKPPAQKRVRFPKGKKARPGDEAVNRGRPEEAVGVGIGPTPLTDPRSAAKERAKRRAKSQLSSSVKRLRALSTMSLLLKLLTSVFVSRDDCQILLLIGFGSVERIANDWGIFWQDYEDFVEDGIQIEPFNLNKEREEGYFDADGNFVEYANKNEVEDAWLDSVEVDTKYAGKGFAVTKDDDDVQDLSSDDVGKIKRRIADVLEPGETVLQALRRLKGTSNNKKEKMSAETNRVFDQLTEDATNLMDNGESNVYHEKKEMFEREAGKLCYSEIINQGCCDQYRLQGLELQGLCLGEVEGYGCQKCECSTSQRICWSNLKREVDIWNRSNNTVFEETRVMI